MGDDKSRDMVARFVLLAAAFVAAPLAAEGKLGTLPQGRYLCVLPGDAAGPASRPVEEAWFQVGNGSRYRSAGGLGTYLMTGKDVVFTRGPMRGARFERISERALRRTDLDGELAMLRCVWSGRGD